MENYFNKIIDLALKEDVAEGDITTAATVPKGTIASAELLVKEDGVVSGLEIFKEVFRKVDAEVKVKLLIEDGTKVSAGHVIGNVTGDAASILIAERTALNFLQRMSGISSLTNKFVSKVNHTKAKILDTRKTAPGLRLLDKEAVKLGGGVNHRFGLFDLYLIKDNHISVAGSVTKAIEQCKAHKKKSGNNFKIEIETKNLQEVEEALNGNVDVIMLDNFTTEDLKEAVKFVNGKCFLEASGNVNLNNIKEIAETGIDFISVGALTHSSKTLDISLKITLITG